MTPSPEAMNDLDAAFQLAVESVEKQTALSPFRQKLNTRYNLALYGLYQQATKGDLLEDGDAEGAAAELGRVQRRPGVLNFSGRALWDAWRSRRGMSPDDAKAQYIDIVVKIGGRKHFHCSKDEKSTVQQTLTRLTNALQAARHRASHGDMQPITPSSTGSHLSPQTSTSRSSPRSTSASVDQSESQSETESETGSESFLSSRESIDGDYDRRAHHDVKALLLAELGEDEDGIPVGGDAGSYSRSQSRRASPPPLGMSDDQASRSVRVERTMWHGQLSQETVIRDTPLEPSVDVASNIGISPAQWMLDRGGRPDAAGSMEGIMKGVSQGAYLPQNSHLQHTPTPHVPLHRNYQPSVTPAPTHHQLGTPLETLDSRRDRGQPTLAESMQAIQVSLTALNERLATMEHAQAVLLTTRPSENPWLALMRGMGMSPRSPSRRGWVLNLLFRLLSTVRRAVVDVSFVLVMVCLYKAVWSALRRRVRFGGTMTEDGGRRAVVEFWKGVAGVASKVGKAWQTG